MKIKECQGLKGRSMVREERKEGWKEGRQEDKKEGRMKEGW